MKTYRKEVMDQSFPMPQHYSVETPSQTLPPSDNSVAVKATGKSSILEAPYSHNIAVIGGGAMGSFFAAQLSSVANHKVTVVSQWKEHVAAINQQGLQICSAEALTDRILQDNPKKKRDNSIMATSTVHIEDKQKNGADVVFILVKARDTYTAAKTALQLVKPGGAVVTIQNGIGYEAIVKDVFSADPTVLLSFGITSCGARMSGPGVVQAAGSGATTLFRPTCDSPTSGDIRQKSWQQCVDVLQATGMQVDIQTDDHAAQQQIWRKLVINAVVNPLAALFTVSNGELLSHAPYARVLESLVHEVADVAGHKVAWSAVEMQAEVEKVLKLTSGNRNSMLSDVQRDVETEFEHINGEILKLAELQNKAAPMNKALATIFGALAVDKSATPSSFLLPSPPTPCTMQICKTIAAVRQFRRQVSAAGASETIGFVPTMGALHSGHLSLIKAAKKKCDKVVVSIFVNPTQFTEHEDFGSYPSTLEADIALLSESGLVDAVFTPSPSEMYPNFTGRRSSESPRNNGQAVYVVPDQIENISAEGKSRPHFFTGVSTVCTKLFNIVQPDVAFFGQKDATQVITIQQLVDELNMPLQIEVVETLREADGVAMSSRNVLLSPDDRVVAPVIYKALSRAQEGFRDKGERRVHALREDVRNELQGHPEVHIDYISVADGCSSAELQDDELCAASTLLSVAVTIGNTRLIDNIMLQ